MIPAGTRDSHGGHVLFSGMWECKVVHHDLLCAKGQVAIWLCFIDDILFIWQGTSEDLQTFVAICEFVAPRFLVSPPAYNTVNTSGAVVGYKMHMWHRREIWARSRFLHCDVDKAYHCAKTYWPHYPPDSTKTPEQGKQGTLYFKL